MLLSTFRGPPRPPYRTHIPFAYSMTDPGKLTRPSFARIRIQKLVRRRGPTGLTARVTAALVWFRGASLLATRLAAQYAIPAQLLVVTAARAAGARFVVATAHITLAVLAIIVLAEKMFGLQKILRRTLMVRTAVQSQLETSQEESSMLDLVLLKSRALLGSIDNVDSDDDEDAVGKGGNGGEDGARGDTSCPLCGGTGKIAFEGKMRHEDPCPRCAMILGGPR
mmetsp:Transcript_13187/g.38208  ORF Transcript_13187/g.38208 Transcript_13187/m.38208 type:complete len:224 (+) Transcript_13187:2922-3593(+)